jgi:hypothetical protein
MRRYDSSLGINRPLRGFFTANHWLKPQCDICQLAKWTIQNVRRQPVTLDDCRSGKLIVFPHVKRRVAGGSCDEKAGFFCPNLVVHNDISKVEDDEFTGSAALSSRLIAIRGDRHWELCFRGGGKSIKCRNQAFEFTLVRPNCWSILEMPLFSTRATEEIPHLNERLQD